MPGSGKSVGAAGRIEEYGRRVLVVVAEVVVELAARLVAELLAAAPSTPKAANRVISATRWKYMVGMYDEDPKVRPKPRRKFEFYLTGLRERTPLRIP